MSIIYTISVIMLFLTTMLLKKKEEKIDIVITVFLGIIVFACYNIVICSIINLLGKTFNLITASIINVIISVIVLLKILIKDKKIQKYTLKIEDIVAILIISIIGIIILDIIFGFGNELDIKYIQVDASNHYGMTVNFYETGKIDIGTIPGAYINYGIIFKIFYKYMDTFDGYKLFIMCEMLQFIFSGILCYLVIKKNSKTNSTYVIMILLSILYMIGYPLNGLLCGFVYLQMAINIVAAIFIVLNYYEKINNKYKNILLFFLTFGLMFTYYILVPPIFIAVFINEWFSLGKEKEIKNKSISKFIINNIAIFLIPSIMGLTYFVFPGLIDPVNNFMPTTNMASNQAQKGYIFVNYYSMFIIFIPYGIYYLINKIRIKEIDGVCTVFVCTILYVIFSIILEKNGIIARYYCMKPYYLLWLVMIVITGVSICNIQNNKNRKIYKILSEGIIIIYMIGAILITIKGPVFAKVFEREKETIKSMYNIFPLNRGILLNETFKPLYTSEELKILKATIKQYDINKNTKIIYVEDDLNKEWLRRLLGISENEYEKYITTIKLRKDDIDELKKSNEKIYIICYKNYFVQKYYTELINEIEQNFDRIAKEGKLVIYTNK